MHGFGWIQAALGEIEAMATSQGLTEITRVTIRRGQLSHFPQAELEFAWDLLKKDTICQRASLVVEEEPALMGCPTCGWEILWQGDLANCPACKERLQLVSGTDLQLVHIQGGEQ